MPITYNECILQMKSLQSIFGIRLPENSNNVRFEVPQLPDTGNMHGFVREKRFFNKNEVFTLIGKFIGEYDRTYKDNVSFYYKKTQSRIDQIRENLKDKENGISKIVDIIYEIQQNNRYIGCNIFLDFVLSITTVILASSGALGNNWMQYVGKLGTSRSANFYYFYLEPVSIEKIIENYEYHEKEKRRKEQLEYERAMRPRCTACSRYSWGRCPSCDKQLCSSNECKFNHVCLRIN